MTSCSDDSQAANPTCRTPGFTPAVFYQGKLYVHDYFYQKGLDKLKYEEAAKVVKTVSKDWPDEELSASALEAGTVIYYGINPENGEYDGYLYVQYQGTYIRLIKD